MIIIGGGLSAVAAALAAQQKGADVTIVGGRPGATAMASGAWDMGSLDERRIRVEYETPLSPREQIEKIAVRRPQHPYALMSRTLRDTSLADEMDEALRVLGTHLPRNLVGSLNETMAFFTPLGTLKYTALADPSQAPGNVLKWRKARLLIAGIPGLAGFSVPLLKKVISSVAARLPGKSIDSVEACWLSINGVPQHSLSPFALAERLEENDTFELLANALREQVQHFNATHVLLPAVIGIEKGPRLIEQLHKQCGAQCFEVLATVPSIPGLRRHKILEAALSSANIKILPGTVTGFESVADRITQLVTSGGDVDHLYDFDEVILATGRFIGGGVVRHDIMKEAIFELPVFVDGKVAGASFVGDMLEQDYIDDHALFRVGVKVDRSLRPVSQWNEPLYSNLRAAGSVIGGYRAAADGSGSGVALLSGWLAGREAVR